MEHEHGIRPVNTFDSDCTVNCDQDRYVAFSKLGNGGTPDNKHKQRNLPESEKPTKHHLCSKEGRSATGIGNQCSSISDNDDKKYSVEPRANGDFDTVPTENLRKRSPQDCKQFDGIGMFMNLDSTVYANCQNSAEDQDRVQPEPSHGQLDHEGRDGDKEDGQSQRAPAAPPVSGANPPDGGWGWVVCATCLWVNGTVMGTSNTFGILYNHMRELYALGDDEVSLKTSFVGSCMNGVMFLMCCVSGILCDVIGLRHTALLGGFFCMLGFLSSAFVSKLELLYLTYGVLLGSGFGLVFSPMVAITGHYFKKNLGLVNGIVTFGASAFTVAMSFALPYLLKYFGLKETLIGYAGLGLILTLCTLAWKPLISREYANESEERDGKSQVKHCLSFVTRKILNGRVWKNKRFLFWSLAMSISRFGYLEPYFHMVNHVTHVLPGSNASILITIMAAVSGVSKLIVGKLSDLIRQYRIYFQQGALVVYGIVVICIPFCTTFPGFVVVAVFLGLADAVIMALFGPNAIELVGAGNASQAVGFASLLAIPTFLSAPAITGSMHDHLKTYNLGFHVTGAITLLSSILMCLVANPFQKQIPSTSPVAGDNPTSSSQRVDYGDKNTIDHHANYRHQHNDTSLNSSSCVNNAYELDESLDTNRIETRL